jgi:hypothetical protein
LKQQGFIFFVHKQSNTEILMKKQVKETDVFDSLIIDCIKKMIGLAKEGDFTAKQELNGVTILVNGDSNSELIFRDQQRAQSGYIEKEVGPYPKVELSAEDKENDARVEAKNEEERQKRQAEYEAKARAKQEAVEARMANAPEIELGDADVWEQFKTNNQDGYGGVVVSYAERWARLMQLEMSEGKELKDVAEATSHEANLEGVTGFMYGCAVSTLSHCWKHGEELRRWYNLDNQIGDEGEKTNESGGVLNPAILSIG